MTDRTQLDQLRRDKGRLLAALRQAGAAIRGDQAKCPFHDDKKPSAGVYETDEGVWLFTCHGCDWNDTKQSGDVVDVVRRANGCDFPRALELLGITNGHPSRNGREKRVAGTQAQRKGSRGPSVAEQAANATTRLLGDPDALRHVWTTRGIDTATAERFGIGITGESGARYWTLPVTDASGAMIALKAHRADWQDGKSWWNPKGTKRDHVFPVHLEPGGPVWVCPGELKALAIAALGRAAIGLTSGEGTEKHPNDLPVQAIELLRGRSAAIPGDDDGVGRAWAEHVQRQLADAGIDARIVDLGLDKAAGLKDVGDWITRQLIDEAKIPEQVAADFDTCYEQADPWRGTKVGELWRSPRTWRPATHIPTGLRVLDSALGGGLRTRGVHLLGGKSGYGKTQLATAIAIGAARAGTPVGFLSLELGADEVAQLAAAQLGGIPRNVLAAGAVTGTAGEQLKTCMTAFQDLPFHVLDDDLWRDGLTRDGLSCLVADGVRRYGWQLVVLDYFGLLASPTPDQNSFEADLRNSAALKRIARRHEVAIVVVAAVRKSQGKDFTKPEDISLDDIAGAGRLVYDSTSTLFVWSTQVDDGRSGTMYVRPLKVRFAPLRDDALRLRWYPRTGRIEDL